MKKKLFPLTSEERLKDSPSVFAEIPADGVKGIEGAKDFFGNVIKQIPPESYKKFKIACNEKQTKMTNQYNEKIKEFRIYLEIFKKTQKVYFVLFQI